jgi:uncharacterized membrane protein
MSLLFLCLAVCACVNSTADDAEIQVTVQTDSSALLQNVTSNEITRPEQASPPDITSDTLWQHKKNAGVDFFGIGNEPFWNIEIDEQGQTTIRMADWESAVSLKTPPVSLHSKDSIVYQFADPTKTRIVLYNRSCSDGMSDNVYAQKIKLQYKNLTYSGCGKLFRKF